MKKSLIIPMAIFVVFLSLPVNTLSQEKGPVLKGVFYDSAVEGLTYETQTLSGLTNSKGEFEYRQGETVTFSVGRLVLGSAFATGWMTPADLNIRVDRKITKLKDPRLTNMARFLQSLDEDGNVENGITITNRIAKVVSGYEYLINFQQSEEAFTANSNVVALFADLKATLRTGAQARNHLRRTMLGIKKMTDVQIPMRDGRGWSYCRQAFGEQLIPFFEYWLKGKNTPEIMEVMNAPPVKMAVRTGKGGFFWQFEDEWPIARTKYTKYYLDATPFPWIGDGKRNDFMKLSATVPGKEKTTSYSADVGVSPVPCWSHGVSFVTEALHEDMEIAGYVKLVLWVSSTSEDMDIFASVRVMDENNQKVPYGLSPTVGYYPVGMGWLKVSHRKLDPDKSTFYRPYQTHQLADYAPLQYGEVVPVEIEIWWPTTAVIKKGYRIRLDVHPAEGCDHRREFKYVDSYHLKASNTIYTGPAHISYLQLPVIPSKTP